MEKRLRGRPPKVPKEMLDVARMVGVTTDISTTRGLHNWVYAVHAMGVLKDDLHESKLREHPEFGWLFGSDRRPRNGREWRWGLLSELGRIGYEFGDEVMRDVARQVCVEKDRPTTVKEAIELLRYWRLKTLDEIKEQ